jgi:hypothetical protein
MSIDEHDRVALTAALEQARAEGADRAAQIAAKGWREAAESAVYHCQCRALCLRPWQEPPCVADADDPAERDKAAQKLLREMLALGVSRFHPDPLAAIEAAKQRKAVVS